MATETQAPNAGRRRLLTILLAGVNALTLGLAGAPIVGALVSPILRTRKPQWIRTCERGALAAGAPMKLVVQVPVTDGYAGGTRRVTLWLTIAAQGAVVAMSSECTHMGCNVAWEGERGRFRCPCHGGEYDGQGQVLAGPPLRPLDRLAVEERDGAVWVQV
ncbi:MAG: Rieske (2Fe-2S) protein [Planctomycetes bacterium]|nr:Rieske (2Fe-2S) protein [Planctomycetota bacterium]